MPVITADQLTALARSGANNREIEATLGRPLTATEQATVDRARVVTRLQREAKRQKTKLGSSDRHTVITAERSKVDRVPCEDPKRRARLEADPVAWLRHYMSGTYSRPMERPHLAIVAGAMSAHDNHGRFVVAAERGIGKSAILWGMILYLALSGKQRYPVCVPWADKALKRAFRFWKNALCFNDAIGADYPEFCAPFRHARGIPQRVMTCTWRDTGGLCGAQLTVGEGMIVLPDRLGCIGGSTINGNIRGLNHPQDDGTVLRPTIALLDDVQDRQTAKSPVQVADTCAIIDGDVGGCGDPGRDLPMLMACNCIAPQDVSERYLTHPEWHALRVPCIEAWPDGWDDPKSRAQELWAEWHERFLAIRGDKGHYKKNRREMIRGMKLSAPAAFAGSEQCPDAFYGVMRMYFRMGHEAFMAERQQSPVDPVAAAQVAVTADMIVKRAIGPSRGIIPEGAIRVVAGADINPGITGRLGARITWVAAAFHMYQSECVIAYGIHKLDMPTNPTVGQQVNTIYAGLNSLRVMLGSMGVSDLIYDARGWMNRGATRGQALHYAMIPFTGSQCRATASEGYGNEHYRPKHSTAIRQFEGGHVSRDRVEQRQVEWVPFNKDWYLKNQLESWIAEPGAPGSCILYSGHHDAEFLNQATTRAFIGMVQKHSGPVYDWARVVGNDDYGDCLVLCRVAAAYVGIGTGGQVTLRGQRKRYSQADLNRGR